MDQWLERPMDGWASGWTIIASYTDAIDTSENDFPTDFVIFTKPMTVIPSNRDAIAASGKYTEQMFRSINGIKEEVMDE